MCTQRQHAYEGKEMNKRRFLAFTGLGGLAPAAQASVKPAPRPGPGLLTVSGAIGKGNRGPIDEALDQMMVKHKVAFDRAHVFDAPALQRLPAGQLRPTLRYRANPHALSG